MRAVFIRHGQSTGNAGIPCHGLALLELTELGWQQAMEVAASWIERPSLIVTSPYLRAEQTSEPTLARFPEVPMQVWPIQEFTYLQPSRWNGTLTKDRKPYIDRYWATADPMYFDGEGAESFSILLRRAKAALKHLEAMPENGLVYLFSHGQFIQALNLLVRHGGMTDGEIMRMFWSYDREHAIGNGDRLTLIQEPGGVSMWQSGSVPCGDYEFVRVRAAVAGWSTSTITPTRPIFLLAAFAKNEKANLSKAERNELAKFVKTLFKPTGGDV